MWLKQEGQVERCNNVVKAGRLGCEMQQCGKSKKVRLRDATMWLKQEGQVERWLKDATMWLKQEGQVERCNNVVKAGRLGRATMWLKQEGQVERCNNVVKAGRLG